MFNTLLNKFYELVLIYQNHISWKCESLINHENKIISKAVSQDTEWEAPG